MASMRSTSSSAPSAVLQAKVSQDDGGANRDEDVIPLIGDVISIL